MYVSPWCSLFPPLASSAAQAFGLVFIFIGFVEDNGATMP